MAQIRSVLAALLLSVFVAGCATAMLTPEERQALTPAGRVFAVQGELNQALAAVETYAAQPFCSPAVVVACADWRVVVRLEGIASNAAKAVRVARAVVAGGGRDPTAAIRAARAEIRRLSTALAAKEGRP